MEKSKISCFIDLDGVMADYEAGIRAMGFVIDENLNRSSHLLPNSGSEKKRKMYEAVQGTTFYATLPLMPGATRLYNHVRTIDPKPIILTAAPKFGAGEDDYYTNPYWLGAAFHKRNWVETVMLPQACLERKTLLERSLDHFSDHQERIRIEDERFICTTSARKHLFMHRKRSDHQILIDDRPDNCEAWREAGGIAIQHSEVEDTIAQLDSYVWGIETDDDVPLHGD